MEQEYAALDTRHVILDTAAIYHDFDLSNRDTERLLREAARGAYRVFVPEVVIQEMTFHCSEQLVKTRRDLDDARRFLNRVLPYEVGELYVHAELERAARSYEASLRRRLHEQGVQILPLPRGSRAIRDLLWRERTKRKPFKPDGQGVRDALLWESVLELCRREPRPVALITGNTRDFATAKGDELHAHLLQDLARIGITEATLHPSIAAFNNALVRSLPTPQSGTIPDSSDEAAPGRGK